MVLDSKAGILLTAMAALGLAAAHPATASTTYTENTTSFTGTYGSTTGTGAAGFGAFTVTPTNNDSPPYAGAYIGSASTSEDDAGTPAPSTINDSSGNAFGFYANNGQTTTSTYPTITITQGFSVPTQAAGLDTTGDSFSIDFVSGYNDSGDVGVELTDASGAVGSFFYNQKNVNGAVNPDFYFNGVDTGIGYSAGAITLDYILDSPTSYTLTTTGAVSFTGTGTFTSPITGYEVQQYDTDNGSGPGDHNGFFNNLSVSAAPEPSQVGMIALMGLGLGGLLLTARKRKASGLSA